MTYEDDEPELAGYVPSVGPPLRSPHLILTMRIVVIVGIACLVLPGILTTMNVAAQTAEEACGAWVRYEASEATGASARFELFGPGGVGWQCYSVGAFGGDRAVAFLGLIPVSPKISRVPTAPGNT